jgi:nicotinate-nucleotide adenylyltransferase
VRKSVVAYRIGILGGTFDPVHLGHLVLAEQCREQGQLDQVLFVLAARPPHKQEGSLTAFDKRVEMLSLAIAGQPAFRVEELEKDRPGPSYTVDTLEELGRRCGAAQLHLIVGADCLPDLPNWHNPDRIVELACLLVVARPGWVTWSPEQLRSALRLTKDRVLHQQVVQMPLIDVSSRDLRQRVAENRSIRYLVPHAVESYIEAHRLFKTEGSWPRSHS